MEKFRLYLIICLLCLSLVGCGSKNVTSTPSGIVYSNPPTTVQESTTEEEEELITATAVIKKISDDKIKFMLVDSEKFFTLTYTGGLKVLEKFGSLTTIKKLAVGDIVDVTYNPSKEKAQIIQFSNNCWEFSNIEGLSIDRINKDIKISNKKYKYTDNIIISDDNKIIDMMELCDQDILTVKGYRGKVCSITVTTGHGYVKLKSYDTFIGGMVTIGKQILPVSEDMLIAVKEGTYKLKIENGNNYGTKNIVVTQNKETIVNLAEFQEVAEKECTVLLNVFPKDANITVDGQIQKDGEEFVLKYGKYELNVECSGYQPYTETLVLDKAYKVFNIELLEEETEDSAGEQTDDEDDYDLDDYDEDDYDEDDYNEDDYDEDDYNEDDYDEDDYNEDDYDEDEISSSNNSNNNNSNNNSSNNNSNNNNSSNNNSNDNNSSNNNSNKTTTEVKTTSTEAEEKATTEELITEATTELTLTVQKITVSKPIGVKVYFDSEYIGQAPISFAKETGTHIITLSMTGFKTKSYTVTLVDDGGDVNFEFDNLKTMSAEMLDLIE